MQIRFKNVLVYVLLVLVSLVIGINYVKADGEESNVIVCEYEEFGFTITYDSTKPYKEGSNPSYKISPDYKTNNAAVDVIIDAWKNYPVDIIPDYDNDDFYKILKDNNACPSGFHVGVYTHSTFDAQGKRDVDEWWVLPTSVQDKVIYFATEKTFQKKYREYTLGGKEDVANSDAFTKGFEKWCAGGIEGFLAGDCDGLDALMGGIWGTGGWIASSGGTAIKDSALLTLGGMGAPVDKFLEKDKNFIYDSKVAVDLGIVIYKGENNSIDVNCPQLSSLLYTYSDLVDSYDSTASSNKQKALSDIKYYEDTIKTQCRSILRGLNYNGNEAYCIDRCIDINKFFAAEKADTSLAAKQAEACGFSNDLFAWLRNIFRWIKYIVPVLLIALSMLDFIKAMGSEKDDDMKKAQKNFTIRLLAAALIFLTPSLVEFVLDKMGFIYEGCGLF